MDQGFSTRQVCRITGLSARQLGYWRKTGLISPAMETRGGHARYSFIDLISLKTASRLIDAGVSVQRIRQCLRSLSRFLPNTDTPLQELSLVATGDVVLVLRSGAAFDALTGQEWILQVADLEHEARLLLSDCDVPRQWELFRDPTDPNLEKINHLSQ
ncbi:MAG: MerR family transcriptional regulator [Gammaproteobacteria bacterium]|nr:MerR family transcriptional regulator [Gammaproteobacteria bacterium]